MLKVIDTLYDNANMAVKKQIALVKIKNDNLFEEVIKMKYDIPNENYEEKFDTLNKKIKNYYADLIAKNQEE